MKPTKEIKVDFTLTGFIVSILLIGAIITAFSLLISNVIDGYNLSSISGNTNVARYQNISQTMMNDVESLEESTTIKQNENKIDVIGGYFSSGYTSLKLAAKSFGYFGDMIRYAGNDLGAGMGISFFNYYVAAVLIILIIGVLLAVLLKWRV